MKKWHQTCNRHVARPSMNSCPSPVLYGDTKLALYETRSKRAGLSRNCFFPAARAAHHEIACYNRKHQLRQLASPLSQANDRHAKTTTMLSALGLGHFALHARGRRRLPDLRAISQKTAESDRVAPASLQP